MAKLVTIFFVATALAVAAGNDGDDFALADHGGDDIQTYTVEVPHVKKFLKKTWKQYQSASSELTSKLAHLPMSQFGEFIDATVGLFEEKNIDTLKWEMQFSRGAAVGVTANGNHKALPNIANMEQIIQSAGKRLDMSVKGPIKKRGSGYTLDADVAALEMDLGKCVRNDTFEEKLSDDVEDLSDKMMQSGVAVYLKYWKKWGLIVLGILITLAGIPILATKTGENESPVWFGIGIGLILAGIITFVIGIALPSGKHTLKKVRDERKGSVEYSATGGGL